MFRQLTDIASRLAGYSQPQPQTDWSPDDFAGDDELLNDIENSGTNESIDGFVDIKNDPDEPHPEPEDQLEGLPPIGSAERDMRSRIEMLEQEKATYLNIQEQQLFEESRLSPEEIQTRIDDIQRKIDSISQEISNIEKPDVLKIIEPIQDSDILSYYNTHNFTVYNLSWFNTYVNRTSGEKMQENILIKDIRPNDPSKFCKVFPHISEKILSAPQQRFLDTATIEQLRRKHKTVFKPTSKDNVVYTRHNLNYDYGTIPMLKQIARSFDIPEAILTDSDSSRNQTEQLIDYILDYSNYTTEERIKKDLKEIFHHEEVNHMIRKTWNRMDFNTNSYFAYIAQKIFLTNIEYKLKSVPDNAYNCIPFNYDKTSGYSYDTNPGRNAFTADIPYDEVLSRIFDVKPGKRVITELHLPGHSCLLISQYFKDKYGLRNKLIFYNPNSSSSNVYRRIKSFIEQKYTDIKKTQWPFIWINSDEISDSKYSVQKGPTCSLFSKKLWLLLVLNPTIDAEILINYSFNQTNNIVKQHILTFYSIIYFVELFLEKITTTPTSSDDNWFEKLVSMCKTLTINIVYIIESYLISNKYLTLNGCYNFKLKSDILDKLQVLLPDYNPIFDMYKSDDNYRVFRDELKQPQLVPQEFIPDPIPDSPAIASKKYSKKKKSKRRKSKRSKSKKNKYKKYSKKRKSKKYSKKKKIKNK